MISRPPLEMGNRPARYAQRLKGIQGFEPDQRCGGAARHRAAEIPS